MAATMRRLHLCRRSFVFNQKRCSSVVSAQALPTNNEEPKSLYPPIKPKYPSGRWGGMDPGYAWIWHKSREDSLAIPDAQQRTAALCEKEMNQLVLTVRDRRPRTLDFKKYVTKTHVVSGLPEIYGTALDSALLDELTFRLSPLICDMIVMETDQLQRRGFLKKFGTTGDRHHQELSHLLLRSMLTNLTTQMSAQFPHLLTMQFDEKVDISAMWDRHGIKRTRTRMVHPEKMAYDTVDDQRVTAKTKADFVLRTDKPLPEFVSRDEAPSVGGELMELKFSPWVYGQKYEIKGKRTVEAGHVWGDPCEFGFLSVLNTVWSRHPADKYGPHHAQDARLGQGIGTSFVWLAAQAHNQGFNTLVDLTYPLTTQTILTDGQHWQFLAYQLNTLELWKNNDANNFNNICWVSDEAKLYAGVEEGKVQGFNSDVLRQLIAFLALAPSDRLYYLRPTLPPTAVNPKDKKEFIPLRKEKVVVVEEEKYVIAD